MKLLVLLTVWTPWLVAAQQITCPEGTEEATPPESRNILWECNSFPSGDALGGCDWGTDEIMWGVSHINSEPDPAGSGQSVLSIFYPIGSWADHPIQDDPDRVNRGGTQFYSRAFPQRDELYLEYDVHFKEGFDFVLGGKLPGFYGGDGRCDSGNYEECFSSRFMWRADGDFEIYGYIPGMFDDCLDDCFFCDCPLNVCNYIYGHSFGRGSFRFVPGQWYTVSQFIKLNDPGQANGEMQLIVDGEVLYRIVDLRMRETAALKIDTLFFSTYFGGSTEVWASTADTNAYFRDFKVFE